MDIADGLATDTDPLFLSLFTHILNTYALLHPSRDEVPYILMVKNRLKV